MAILDYLYQSPTEQKPQGGLLGMDTRDILAGSRQLSRPKVGLEAIYSGPQDIFEATRGQKALRTATPLVAEGRFGQAAKDIQAQDPQMAMKFAQQGAKQKQFQVEQTEKYRRALALAQAQAGLKPKPLDPFEKKRREEFGKTIEAETAKSTERMSSYDRAEQLLDAGVETGGQYKIPGSQTLATAFDPRVAEFNSLSEKLVPTMREAGSGSSSDADIQMFRNATFSLDKPTGTNRNILRGAKALESNKLSKNEFKSYALGQGMTTTNADRKWKEYLEQNPIFEHQKGKENIDYELNQNRKTWEEYFTQPGGGVDMNDPKVQQAIQSGYSVEDIKKFLNK